MRTDIEAKRDLDEFDANCNTCSLLQRVAAPKDKFGFLLGTCVNQASAKKPYQERDGVMAFHPQDVMLMSCHVPRNKK